MSGATALRRAKESSTPAMPLAHNLDDALRAGELHTMEYASQVASMSPEKTRIEYQDNGKRHFEELTSQYLARQKVIGKEAAKRELLASFANGQHFRNGAGACTSMPSPGRATTQSSTDTASPLSKNEVFHLATPRNNNLAPSAPTGDGTTAYTADLLYRADGTDTDTARTSVTEEEQTGAATGTAAAVAVAQGTATDEIGLREQPAYRSAETQTPSERVNRNLERISDQGRQGRAPSRRDRAPPAHKEEDLGFFANLWACCSGSRN